MATLGRILEVLGPAVFRLVSSSDSAHADVSDIALKDPAEPLTVGSGTLVLAVGADTDNVAALIRQCGAAGVPAVACKPPAADDMRLCEAADRAGVALIRVDPEVAWGQLFLLGRDAIASTGQPVDREASSIRLGDLFALADVIATRAGGPVTIEDTRSRVLAYSTTPLEELDEPRRQTILGRAVPELWLRHLQDSGVLQKLWESDEVVELPPSPEAGLRRRWAVRIRAGKQVLGAVWLAEGLHPVAPEPEETLLEASRFVAMHLLAHRSREDVEQQIRGDLLRQLLEGVGSPELLAERLGIAVDGCYTVIAFQVSDTEGGDAMTLRDSVLSLIALHSEAFRWQAASIWLDGKVYTLLPTTPIPSDRLRGLAEDLAERMTSGLAVSVAAGVGSTVTNLAHAVRSRREADEVLRALAVSGGSVATIDDVATQRLLLVLSDLLPEHPEFITDKVRSLVNADDAGTYVQTLRAYLDGFGSIPKAAEALDVHPNTLRYRLRRALEIAELDLADADERIVLELGLRLLAGDAPPQ